MFVDPADLIATQGIEDDWLVVRDEYSALAEGEFVSWPENDLYEFGWKTFALMALGQLLGSNASRCPRTCDLLAGAGRVVNAGFSKLASGAKVEPHTGYTPTVIRYHLGIDIPAACGIQVGDERRCWEEGKLLAFDDTVEHHAWNDGPGERVILLFDVLKPGTQLEITPSARSAVEDYLKEQTDSKHA